MSFASTSRPQRPSTLLRFLLLLLTFHNHVHAIGIQIIQPPRDATLVAGPVNISWTDAGGSPSMSELTTYNLQLIVGGNNIDTDSRVIQTLVDKGSVATGFTSVNISSDTAQSIQNGFYLCMTSNASNGKIVLNYSGRFTLLQMTGSTDPVYVQGAAAFVGGANVPATQINVPIGGGSSSSSNNDNNTSSETSSNSSVAANTPPSSSSSSSSSSISTGTIIGVAVVGVGVGVALVAMSWWLWAMRQRRRKKTQEKQRNVDNPYIGGKAELASHSPESSVSSTPVTTQNESVELAERRTSAKAYEMEGHDHDTLAEMEGPPVIHELEGEWTGWEMSGARRSRHRSYDPTR